MWIPQGHPKEITQILRKSEGPYLLCYPWKMESYKTSHYFTKQYVKRAIKILKDTCWLWQVEISDEKGKCKSHIAV